MYGIVNQSISGLIIDNYGIDRWNEILAKSKIQDGNFLNNQLYDDSVTYDLAINAAEILQVPLRDILLAFGRYWILKTGGEKYGHLMKSGGADFISFIKNLPTLHTRIMLMFPDIRPPEFIIDVDENNHVTLHYFSSRNGLTDFMEGLIWGLGEFFKVSLDIRLLQAKDKTHDHDIFLIKLLS